MNGKTFIYYLPPKIKKKECRLLLKKEKHILKGYKAVQQYV